MTLETDSELDPAIIDALRRDALVQVPAGRRERVASRLAAGAGVVALSTSVAGASQVAASAGAAGISGIAPVASSAAALTAVGLAKMLGIGLALGSVTGLGMHFGFRALEAAPQHAVPATNVALKATQATSSAPPLPDARVAVTAPPAPAVARMQKEPRAPRSAPVAAPTVQVNPTPELPESGVGRAGTPGLAEQQALLDEASACLRRGDGIAALAAVHAHLERFPSTALEEEREAVTIKALALTGNRFQAAQRLGSFGTRFPKSLFLPSLRAALEPPRAERGVTDSAPSSQTDVGK